MEKVTREGLYPIAAGEDLPQGASRETTRARWTGEFRVPLFGEWFLTGAVVEAYRAGPGMRQEFHVARLVEGRMVWDA